MAHFASRPFSDEGLERSELRILITAHYKPNPIHYNPSKEEEDSSESHHSPLQIQQIQQGEGVSSEYHHSSPLIQIQPIAKSYRRKREDLKNPEVQKNQKNRKNSPETTESSEEEL